MVRGYARTCASIQTGPQHVPTHLSRGDLGLGESTGFRTSGMNGTSVEPLTMNETG